ncbi:1116_t:CDS:10, partial [Funneliformis caledonium]
YWERCPTLWGSVADWDLHFINEMPGSSCEDAHKTLASELEILLKHFTKDSPEWFKAKSIRKQLKVLGSMLWSGSIGPTMPLGSMLWSGLKGLTMPCVTTQSLKKTKYIVVSSIWKEHQEGLLKATVENKINENINKRKIENIARNATSATAEAYYATSDYEIPKRSRTDHKNLGDCEQFQQPRSPERHITPEVEEKECSLYDTFPVHIHKRPEPNPFLVGNKREHDIDEEDDEFNADLTIVGGKSIDWIISGINIREKLTKYQLDVNLFKTHPEYYDIIFFNLNDEDGFLGTLDTSIVAQMREEIRRPEKTKENLNCRNAEKIDSFEKRFALHFVSHMMELMDDVNLFNDSMSEGTYIVNVLTPILGYFFNKKKKDWLVSYGETCLKACAKDVNSNKKDDERRSPGKRIDTIISMREENKEISVTEVSGPPMKNDWAHFKSDRMKIMKMLKTLINQYAELNPSSDITLIKLYGLQVYLNELTIYEFQLKYTEIYTAEAILTFPLPKTWADMAKADNAVISLLHYERLLSESSRSVRDFLWVNDYKVESIKMTTRMIHSPESIEKAKNTKNTSKTKKTNKARVN